MSSTAVTISNGGDDPVITISTLRLQQLELDAARAQLLQARVDEIDIALQVEQARNEKHAEALMQVARSSDDRAREMEQQHAAAIVNKDVVIAKLETAVIAKDAATAELKASHVSAISKLEAENAALKSRVATLEAQAASKLSEIHTVLAALQTLEIFPARQVDSRQFASWHHGPVPPLPLPPHLTSVAVQAFIFDRTWAAAVTNNVKIDDATGTRLSVTGRPGFAPTFRSSASLPRVRAAATTANTTQQQQATTARPQHPLPAYRVVVEAYGAGGACQLGFLPSHMMDSDGAAAVAEKVVTPSPDQHIHRYGGWFIDVFPSHPNVVDPCPRNGWVELPPAPPATAGAAATAGGEGGGSYSTYATTKEVPRVPEGSAVEFAVDYAAGTCRVAFYTPTAVAGGFMEPPYAKMELRFVATEVTKSGIPARSVPTAATDSHMKLYPAVSVNTLGAALRFMA